MLSRLELKLEGFKALIETGGDMSIRSRMQLMGVGLVFIHVVLLSAIVL